MEQFANPTDHTFTILAHDFGFGSNGQSWVLFLCKGSLPHHGSKVRTVRHGAAK